MATPTEVKTEARTWHSPLPVPVSVPATITSAEVAELVRNKIAGKDFVVVDVRCLDFEGPFTGCINLPAQLFHFTLPT
ncbi:hypothetical protein BDK51DRAFT_9924, partial [Blyttiomyces helicus]